MAGETAKCEAVCLRIVPWSRTSHIVDWLTPLGRVACVVKGAVRPKSAFLGQYDLNYTCEIVYYARARGELHALRECAPLDGREAMRGDYRALALADYFRTQVAELAPSGPECGDWYRLLSDALARLDAAAADRSAGRPAASGRYLAELLDFELAVLHLAGLAPELEAEGGAFALRGERQIPVPAEVAGCLRSPLSEKNPQILLDAARVIGVFYSFHLDCALDARRMVLRMINEQ